MRALIDDAGLRERLGKQGRQRFETGFTPEAIVPRFETIYSDVIEGRWTPEASSPVPSSAVPPARSGVTALPPSGA
jgi:hypothetical protein